MELSKEKSEEIANLIEMAKFPLTQIDTEYLDLLASSFNGQAQRQESLSVLNSSYLQEKNELLYENGRALNHLSKFIESLKRCDKIKQEIAGAEQTQQEINKIFL